MRHTALLSDGFSYDPETKSLWIQDELQNNQNKNSITDINKSVSG